MNSRNAILSAIALSRLNEIGRYTQQNFGRAQRVKYMDGLYRAIEELCQRPSLGRNFPGFESAFLRYRVGSHFIYFQFDESVLSVLSVLHVSMDPSLHLEPKT